MTSTVIYSLIASLVLVGLAILVRVGLGRRGSGWAVAAEYLVEHFEDLMRDMFGRDPRPFTPLVVTLALFIATANLLGLVPGLRSPTADFSATAALAVLVFFAVPFYGIRGPRGPRPPAALPRADALAAPLRDHHRVLADAGAGRAPLRECHE